MTDCSWVGGDNYTQDYLEMISILKAQPAKPRVFVMSPPPLYPPFPYEMNKTVINAVLPQVILPSIPLASGAEPNVIDLFDAMGGPNLTLPGDFCDGCHPKDAGYIIMANVIYDVISKIIEEENWPGYVEATPEQIRAAHPREEWNAGLFARRVADDDQQSKSGAAEGGWRVKEM